jgi:tetratricopeptide (TPR) repeat protein/DNA-binding XRE family transcriptional regulator
MFGKTVREHRQRSGLTQEDLARRAGVDVKTIRSIETGRSVPRSSTVHLLARALDLGGVDSDRFCSAAVPAASSEASGQRPGAPAQLPLDGHGFTGRTAHLAALDVIASTASGQPTAVGICAVWGTAGVGKTALAVHWAHRVRDRFPDGQLYVNLRGFGPSSTVMDPAEAIRRFLDALDVPPGRIPTDLDAQAALYRTLLADRRLLIVLDNAYDADQIRPLLPGAPGCLVLITSRNELTSLVVREGAHPLPLDLLTRDEARALLSRRIGADRVAADPAATTEIINRCVRLPLALAIVAARATTQLGRPLAGLAAELRDTRDRLDLLTAGDPATDVRAVLTWSYKTLTPGAAQLLRLLGLHPGPDICAEAAASLAGLSPHRTRPILAELVRTHLITEHLPGRYTFHDLLRAYAVEQAHSTDTDQQRHAATHRILDHYLHSAHAAAMLLVPTRDPITLTPVQPGVTPQAFTDDEQAQRWFDGEYPVALAAVGHAAASGFETHTWQLAWTLADALDRRGRWREWTTIQHAAVTAAHRLADVPAQALLHRLMSRPYVQLSQYDDAHTELHRALDLYRQCDDKAGQAHTLYNLGWVWERQGRQTDPLHHIRKALELFWQASELYQAVGHQRGEADTLSGIGWYLAQLGDHQEALTRCEQALTLHQELGDRHSEAATWDSLGYIHHHLGHDPEAIACYQRALDICRNLGDRYWEADTLTRVGDTLHATGDPAAARDAWQRALAIFNDLDHPDAAQITAKLANIDAPVPLPDPSS